MVGEKTIPYLVRGPLALNPRSGDLRGPAGSMRLSFGGRMLLAALMKHSLVTEADMLLTVFPPPSTQPTKPQQALRMQVMRVRKALSRVGLPGNVLHNWHGFGYGLLLQPAATAFRVFDGAALDLLTTLLASHPDQAAVARLG